MQSPNIQIIKSTLTDFITVNFGNCDVEKANFQIEFDPDEIQEPKTNMDEIKFYWAIPPHFKKDIDLRTICDLLVTGRNEIPLWIKVDKNENHFLLRISKRFRKVKVVKEYHKDNHFYPFLKI